MIPKSLVVVLAALFFVGGCVTDVPKQKHRPCAVCTTTTTKVDLETSTTTTTTTSTDFTTSTSLTISTSLATITNYTTSTSLTTSTILTTSTSNTTSTTTTTTTTTTGVCAPTCAAASELLQNGDFSDDTPYPWELYAYTGADGSISLDDKVQYEGNASLRYSYYDYTHNPAIQYVRQRIDEKCLTSDQAYRFSAWIRFEAVATEEGYGCYFGQALCTYGDDGPAGAGAIIPAEDAVNEWKQATVDCQFPQEALDEGSRIYVAVQLYCDNASAWVDSTRFDVETVESVRASQTIWGKGPKEAE